MVPLAILAKFAHTRQKNPIDALVRERMRYINLWIGRFWRAPFTGLTALAWTIAWWIGAAIPTLLLWDWLNWTPYALFFPAVAVIAARSGPIYGLVAAGAAVVLVLARFSSAIERLWLPSGAVFLASCVISLLAHWARQAMSQLEKAEEARKLLLDNEKELRAKAEEANRLKDEFLATLSHELRTPLNAILGWANLLLSGRLETSEVRQAAEVIERNTKVQAQLVDDLLDMNRILSGKIRIDVQNVELPAIVEAAIISTRPAMEAKKIDVDKTIDFSASPIRGDPSRLQQVISNLLSNAIKFTAEGGKIGVALKETDSDVEIQVADSGIGIPPDQLPFIFDRFRQGDASKTRRHGGLGLGLAISRHLVELHGGTIHAQSAGKSQGSTFRVTIPVPVGIRGLARETERLDLAGRDSRSEKWRVPNLSGLSVLIVDDDPDARVLVEQMLDGSGAEILLAASAQRALDICGRQRIDILISDIGMPEMDGLEMIRQLRSHEGGRSLLAIALTAFAHLEDRQAVLREGFDFFTSKPVDVGELMVLVSKCFSRLAKLKSELEPSKQRVAPDLG